MNEGRERGGLAQASTRNGRRREDGNGASRYRKSRKIACTPILAGLVILVTSFSIAAPASASQVLSASNQTADLWTATGNSTGPFIVPGTYVTFVCTHGTISLDGAKYCDHTTTAPIDLCDSTWCQFDMTGTKDSGYTFYGWVVSGYASVLCGTCLSTTLSVNVPNLGNIYSASVTLNTTPPPPPTRITITVIAFVNYSTGWTPAEVQACLGSNCSTAGNGGTLPMNQNTAYTLSIAYPQWDVQISRWTSNAGSFSDNSSSPTTFTPSHSGVLNLIAMNKQPIWPWAGYIASPQFNTIPVGDAPTSNCFGGAPCLGPQGTTNGSGKTCVISSFAETAGSFMYVVINYLAGTNIITSVADGGTDTFAYIGGEFANHQSVAFYDVVSEHGGSVSITVTVTTTVFGTCRVGQLSPGTAVGVVGTGNSTSHGTGLSVTNAATHEPSLLLGVFGSTRPSGAWSLSGPHGGWLSGGQQGTGWNPGTESELFGYNDSTAGTVTFSLSVTSSVSISGIAVEFYLSSGRNISSVSAEFTIPASVGSDTGIWIGIGGLGAYDNLWQVGVDFMPGQNPLGFYEACGPSQPCVSVGKGAPQNISMPIRANDVVDVTVTSSGTWSTFSMFDKTRNTTATGAVQWVATQTTGEWIVEPKGNVGSVVIPFAQLTVNGASAGSYSPYMGVQADQYSESPSALAFIGPSSPEFSVD